MEDLSRIQTFVRVAERKSFTKAANDLRLSPSAVSKHVSELEDRMGFSLLIRSTRGVSLTEVGAAFYTQCSQVIAELDNAISYAKDLHGTPRGTLKIGAVPSFARWGLAPLLPEFLRLYPDIKLELITGTPAMNIIEEGLDVVIRSKTLPDPSLDFREIGPVPYAICAAPSYLAVHGAPAQPEDLARHNCLTHSVYAPRDWPFFVRRGSRENVVRVGGSFESNNGEALLHLALRGVGIIRLPEYVVSEAIAGGELVALFPHLTSSHQVMRVYFVASQHLPVKIVNFLNFLDARLGLRQAS